MNAVQVEQKSYEMPPREGNQHRAFSHRRRRRAIGCATTKRSSAPAILTMGDGNAPPYLQLANIWMILNVGGGPTPGQADSNAQRARPESHQQFL